MSSSSSASDAPSVLSMRGAASLSPDVVRSVYQRIKSAYCGEFPSERLTFQEPDDVVSTCNGSVMTVDVWPIVEVTPAKTELIKNRLSGTGGDVCIWPVIHPTRGPVIRVSWSAPSGSAGSPRDEELSASYTMVIVVILFFVVLSVYWLRLASFSTKLEWVNSFVPGSREYILRFMEWVGSFQKSQ